MRPTQAASRQLHQDIRRNTPVSPVRQGFNLAQYLELEAARDIKHEYFRGEVFAIDGGSPRQSLIGTNFTGEARQRLAGKPCVAYNSDLRIKIEETGLFTYPDASIICGELLLDDVVPNTALNPTVLVEVLSDSTEKYDRGKKSEHYRRIGSLKELVLISQDRPLVECFSRQASGAWLMTDAHELDKSLTLSSVGISIPLSEIYRNVRFDPPEAPAPPAGIRHSDPGS